jgi:hypothetical protein
LSILAKSAERFDCTSLPYFDHGHRKLTDSLKPASLISS